jgi:amino acid permease
VVVYCYFNPMEGAPEPGEIRLIHFTPTFVSTFPVQVFAFTCAQNVGFGHRILVASTHSMTKLFPIYNELVNNTQRHMNVVIGTSIGSAVGIYEIIGVFGYLTFGSKVRTSASKPRLNLSHQRRLARMSLQCTHLLQFSSLSGNWPLRFLSCFRIPCRFTRVAIVSKRFFIWVTRHRIQPWRMKMTTSKSSTSTGPEKCRHSNIRCSQ